MLEYLSNSGRSVPHSVLGIGRIKIQELFFVAFSESLNFNGLDFITDFKTMIVLTSVVVVLDT